MPWRRIYLYVCFAPAAVLAFGALTLSGLYFIFAASLPSVDQLEDIRPNLITRIYDRNGELVQEFYTQRRIVVPFARFPEHLIQALLATEDRGFYDHWGIDLRANFRTLATNLLSGDLTGAGASTITQQLSRELFLTRQKIIIRKIKEWYVAIAIEKRYSKDEIIAMYLNQHNFGKGAYGVEAAANLYFSKSVDSLTIGEAATLIGILQSPNRNNPIDHPDHAVRRRNVVLLAMLDAGYLDARVADSLVATPLELHVTPPPVGEAPYFAEMVRKYIEDMYGVDALYANGYSIYTTLDMRLQRFADAAVNKNTDELQRYVEQHHNLTEDAYAESYLDSTASPPTVRRRYKRLQAALIAVDNETGGLLALVGGIDFTKYKFNFATQGRRQPGSAFKPFVYTAAMDNGWSPAMILNDTPVVITDELGREYRPGNYDHTYKGPTTLRAGLAASRNVIAIKLLERVGYHTVAEYAHRMGVTSKIYEAPSMALGTSEVSPWEMARAYMVFPNLGVRTEPWFISRIEDREGRLVEEHTRTERYEVLSPATAFVMCDMLRSVVAGGTGAAAGSYGVNFPTGGKTGTTNKYTDAWFCGFSSYMTAIVWTGFEDKTIIGYGMTGSRAALPVWAEFMAKAHTGLPQRWVQKPAGVFGVTVCLDSGLRAGPHCINTKTDIASTPPTEEVCNMDHTGGQLIHFVDEGAFAGYNPEDPPPDEFSHF